MKKKLSAKFIIGAILAFLAFLMCFASKWGMKNFQFTFETLVFHLKVPMQGANIKTFLSFGKRCLLPATLLTMVVMFLFLNPFNKEFKIKFKNRLYKIYPFHENVYMMFIVFSFIFSLITSFDRVGFFTYVKYQYTDSSFIEEHYVDPRDVSITFPEQKRNLIYIYVESLETTYFDEANGGYMEDDLMPNLTNLSKEGINFSNTSLLGGALEVTGTTWTIAGIVAQTAGIPLKLPINGNSYGKYTSFLPGAYTLGEILDENGYNQMFLLGSDASFGGRTNYFTQHGNYEIYDYYSAMDEEKITRDYFEWWGYEDKKLFSYAKEKLSDIASKDEPFNFTMLTVDMHFPEGFLDSECPTPYDKNMSNVVSCTDTRLIDFINWIREQDFYENTTIIIVGDHLSMDNVYFENVSDDYIRTSYDLIINSSITTENVKNREFSTIDLFPTTLASLGVTIEGDRLGLGTNLFSNQRTLIEEYGIKYVNEELAKSSKFFNKTILYPNKNAS